MSRIGNRLLEIPAGVSVEMKDGNVTVKGPKGELSVKAVDKIEVAVEENHVKVTRADEENSTKALHGTMNANIAQMIEGVTKGFQKDLEIIGVGYRFAVSGKKLTINAGYSHPVVMDIPEGLTVDVVSNTEISIKGISAMAVGEFAANVRKVRQPEPYKGKGIRYKDEHVRRKEGKKAAK